MSRFIFITGGVVSSLGKGIASASLGALLQARGLSVNMIKLDPYINVDPGTMSPFQHGEVYVTDDGAETDLDLGHYERFSGVRCSQSSNYTTGRIWAARHDGKTLLWKREIADTTMAIADFGTSPHGDILVADHLGQRDVDQPHADQVHVGRPRTVSTQAMDHLDARTEVAQHRVAEAEHQGLGGGSNHRVHELRNRSMRALRPARKHR